MMVEPSRPLIFATLTWLVLAAVPVVAVDTSDSQSTRSSVDQTDRQRSELAATERAKAKVWGLSAIEWRRYRQLMEGVRGSVSPASISPIKVLGIHARDDAERHRYAEQWARLMQEDVGRILAFQHAYDQVARRLFLGQPLIDRALLPNRSDEESVLGTGDRILLFTRPDCAGCDALLERLLGRLDRVAGIDIYLSDIPSDEVQVVRDWAATRSIQPEWVRTRRVTLNFTAGALERLAPGTSDLPVLMRRRGESVTPLAGSAL